jgi:hypothetical protein
MVLEGAKKTTTPEPACRNSHVCGFEWYEWARSPAQPHEQDSLTSDELSDEVLERIAAHDFSMRTVFSDVVLAPGAGAIPHQALIVATADRNVIDGHTGLFSRPLMDFLTKYIGFVEAKKFLPAFQAAVRSKADAPR